jgi:hypothetical protein
MPGAPDTEYLDVEPPRFLDIFFVVSTIGKDLVPRNPSIRNMDILRGNIDMIEKLVVHEAPVAFRMLTLEAVVLIQIKGHHILEAQPFIPVRRNQALVEQ